jgi:GPH family glycoside/pentoside/hexuronide:cation symporter
MQDVLDAPEYSALCLLVYFAAAMIAMPFWVKYARRIGAIRCLFSTMLLAVVSFVGASQLGHGDLVPFLVICLLTGAAFGADAALLPSLLSDALSRSRTSEHAAFGIWTAISKLTLALAAGIALPAVEWMQRIDSLHSDALRFGYGLLPCAIKLMAMACLIIYHRLQQRSAS